MMQIPPGDQPRPEVDELVLGRLVPIGVETQQRDLLRGVCGQRVLDLSRDEVDPVHRVAGAGHVGPNVVDVGRAPSRRVGGGSGEVELDLRRFVAEVLVDLGRRRHALVGVEEVEVAVVDAGTEERQRYGHAAAAPPHAAFDDRAGDRCVGDVPGRRGRGEDPLGAGHRVRAHLLEQRDIGRLEVRRDVLVAHDLEAELAGDGTGDVSGAHGVVRSGRVRSWPTMGHTRREAVRSSP